MHEVQNSFAEKKKNFEVISYLIVFRALSYWTLLNPLFKFSAWSLSFKILASSSSTLVMSPYVTLKQPYARQFTVTIITQATSAAHL